MTYRLCFCSLSTGCPGHSTCPGHTFGPGEGAPQPVPHCHQYHGDRWKYHQWTVCLCECCHQWLLWITTGDLWHYVLASVNSVSMWMSPSVNAVYESPPVNSEIVRWHQWAVCLCECHRQWFLTMWLSTAEKQIWCPFACQDPTIFNTHPHNIRRASSVSFYGLANVRILLHSISLTLCFIGCTEHAVLCLSEVKWLGGGDNISSS